MDDLEKWLDDEINLLNSMDDDGEVTKCKYVLAPRYIYDYKLTVNYIFRVKPQHVYDSGWRFLHGTEDQEIMSKFSEMAECYDFTDILSIEGNEIIEKYIDSPIGSVFIREEGTEDFVPDDDELNEDVEGADVEDLFTITTCDIDRIIELAGKVYDQLVVIKGSDLEMNRQDFLASIEASCKDRSPFILNEMEESFQKVFEDNEQLIGEKMQAEEEQKIRDKIESIEKEQNRDLSRADSLFRKSIFLDIVLWILLLICGRISNHYSTNSSFSFPISQHTVVVIGAILMVLLVVGGLGMYIVYVTRRVLISNKYRPVLYSMKKELADVSHVDKSYM